MEIFQAGAVGLLLGSLLAGRAHPRRPIFVANLGSRRTLCRSPLRGALQPSPLSSPTARPRWPRFRNPVCQTSSRPPSRPVCRPASLRTTGSCLLGAMPLGYVLTRSRRAPGPAGRRCGAAAAVGVACAGTAGMPGVRRFPATDNVPTPSHRRPSSVANTGTRTRPNRRAHQPIVGRRTKRRYQAGHDAPARQLPDRPRVVGHGCHLLLRRLHEQRAPCIRPACPYSRPRGPMMFGAAGAWTNSGLRRGRAWRGGEREARAESGSQGGQLVEVGRGRSGAAAVRSRGGAVGDVARVVVVLAVVRGRRVWSAECGIGPGRPRWRLWPGSR